MSVFGFKSDVVVLYCKQSVSEPKNLPFNGGSKRGSKIDDKEYVEYHLDASRWECLD